MKFIEEKEPILNFDRVCLFISYEQRSVQVATKLVEKRYNGEVHLFYCDDLPCKNTIATIEKINRSFNNRAEIWPVSYHDPSPVIQAVRKLKWSNDIYCLIDITSFNRGNLFPFLWASGFGRTIFPHLIFTYSAPENYGSWLSNDYDCARNIIGFGGGLEFPHDRVLICVIGFEAGRAHAVIQAAEPSKLILTVGTTPTIEEFYERNLKTIEEVHGSKDLKIFSINVNDPDECLRDLVKIIKEEAPEASIHFAPFNTKLSCLSIWALWLKKNNIRIWNAQPKSYNILNYSKGSTLSRYFRIAWESSNFSKS